MIRLTPAFLRSLRRFNAEQERARDAYVETAKFAAIDAEEERRREIRRLKGYLSVATSPEECAEILAALDEYTPVRQPCGTTGAYQAHRRRGEEPCGPCREARRIYSARFRKGLRP